MDLNAQQHRFLTQLARESRPFLSKELKPATKPADRAPLVVAGLVAEGKELRSATFQLTAAGREWLAANPEPPARSKPVRDQKPSKPAPTPSFPFPNQRVFMLKLAFAPPGEEIDGLSKMIKAADRDALEKLNWIEVRAKRPKLRCELTDAGWKWVEDHLADPIGGNPAGDVLGAVLKRVATFLAANELRLADLLRVKPSAASASAEGDDRQKRVVRRPEADAPVASEPMPAGDLIAEVRAACQRLAHNDLSPHVKLADLRLELAQWDRTLVDATLLELELAGQVRLVGIGDPRELRPGDREAELRTPGGGVRHLLYWTGT